MGRPLLFEEFPELVPRLTVSDLHLSPQLRSA